MSLQQAIIEAVESIIQTKDLNKYNVAMGFFQGYASVDVDPSGTRFCNIKLHYKTEEGDDISAINVPVVYPGSKLMVFDWKLSVGDQMIVWFSDRSLEQWAAGSEPQKLTNTVKDSINHAIALPVVTHHYGPSVVTDKLDMFNIMDRFLGVLLGDKGPLDNPGTASTGSISITAAINELTALRTQIQSALN